MRRSTVLRPLSLVLATGLVALGGCGGGDSGGSKAAAPSAEGPAAGTTEASAEVASTTQTPAVDDGREMPEFEPDSYDLNIPMVDYEWDPQAGDKSVSAEDGGPGFTGEGWDTNMRFQALGSPEAVKGGRITMEIPTWPATLRLAGKDYNTTFNYRAVDLCMESLVGIHPNTLEFTPGLATHWKISEDKSTYTYRINPAARFNDGKEVTSADVLATYKLFMDERILFPSTQLVFAKFNPPVALSKYIVEVTVKQPSWRNFQYFGGMAIFPAHQISIPGDEFLKEFQNKHTATSGPYYLDTASVDLNKSITLTRRDDWWDGDNPAWVGVHNINEYHAVVIQDRNLAFEKVKKGEIDYYVIPKAQWWVEEVVPSKIDAIKRGLIQKRKYYNDSPIGTAGIALNTTRAPLDDVRMRKALGYLRNRPLLIDQLFFNEYQPLASYWQGGTYQNPNNKVLPYDPFAAVELLEEMGWTELDGEGFRMKDGKRLELELTYSSALSEPSLTIYQEDCLKAGIKINLKLVDSSTRWQMMTQRQYDITSTAWGAMVFPNPETSYSSKLAKVVGNNNVTAFSDERVDKLLDAYDAEYDVQRRIDIIREIDGIVSAAYPYVLDWYGASQRVMYWNKFSQPAWGVWRTKDRQDMMYCWWVDPAKEAALEEAKKDPSKTLETEPILHKFWPKWNAKNAQ